MRKKIATTCYETYVKTFGVDPGGFDALPDWAKERWLSVADAVIVDVEGHTCTVSDRMADTWMGYWGKCSACGEHNIHETANYCPSCGARVVKP